MGCGEQVMTSFAPDIFVTNYLNATNQLTSDIQERAFIFMEKGKKGVFLNGRKQYGADSIGIAH